VDALGELEAGEFDLRLIFETEVFLIARGLAVVGVVLLIGARVGFGTDPVDEDVSAFLFV